MKTGIFFDGLFPRPRRSRPDPQFLALTGELRRARRDLSAAYGQFNQAVSPEAIETCVYRIRAGEARCDYLWRAVKACQQGAASRTM